MTEDVSEQGSVRIYVEEKRLEFLKQIQSRKDQHQQGRRLETGFTLFAFKTPERCGLFVTDISTRPAAEVDIEGVARFGSFLSKGTAALRLVSVG